MFNSTNACDIESLPYSSLITWTNESRICSSICQLVVVFAFTNSHFLSTCCFGTWLHVMTTITLLSLKVFAPTVVVVVGLVQNML